MKKFVIKHESALGPIAQFLFNLDLTKSWSVEFSEYRKARSLPQNATFHMWVGEISKYLLAKGKADWTPEFTKDGLKHTFLGYEDVERVDMNTGVIRVSSELRHTSELETPEMYYFMTQVEHWATDKGCFLTIPVKCEYRTLQEREVA